MALWSTSASPFVSASSPVARIELPVRGDETRRTDELVRIGIPPDPVVEIVPRPTDTMARMGLLTPAAPIRLVFVREPTRPKARR